MTEKNAERMKQAEEFLKDLCGMGDGVGLHGQSIEIVERLIEQAERTIDLENGMKGAAVIANIASTEIRELKEENQRLREALEFYADKENNHYFADYPDSYLTESKVMEDDGEIARRALEGVSNDQTIET